MYTVADPGVSTVFYCRPCLPKHLYARAAAGQLDLPKAPTQTKKKSSKTDEPVEPEALDEDNES
jgi:hypothetical protein